MTDWPWPHFSREEMSCRCGCGSCAMDRDFMYELEVLRNRYGRPMPVTSGYRCPDHNRVVSDTGLNGPHVLGKAVDVAVRRGRDAWDLVFLAMERRFSGIGVSINKGKNPFIHLDRVEGSPRLWSY